MHPEAHLCRFLHRCCTLRGALFALGERGVVLLGGTRVDLPRAADLRRVVPDLDQAATANEDRNLLMKAIARLPRHYREIVMMRHFREMEVNEIAAELHKPEGTIKSWLFRARAMLRKDLTPAMEIG